MTRVPVRIRVTLAFALAMTVFFTAGAALLVARVSSQLDATIDDGLRARAADAGHTSDSETRFTRVLAGGTSYPPRTIIRMIEGEPTRMRVMARRGASGLVVVGQSLEARDEAITQLKAQLVIALPLAVLFTCVAGYFAAAGALRPVKHMTRRARAISAGEPDARLPVPAAKDEIADLGAT